MNEIIIKHITLQDIRFPTGEGKHGSDAVHEAPDYSIVYVTLHTNIDLKGYGFTFTLGRGTEVVKEACNTLIHHIRDRTLLELTENMDIVYQNLTSDGQLRWLGPEKGVIQLATAGLLNALWDIWARYENKPLWKLLCDMEPVKLVKCLAFQWITDAITPEEAVKLLEDQREHQKERIQKIKNDGYPAYTTSCGWLGYSIEQIQILAKEALKKGFKHFKMKVGLDVEDDKKRLAAIREVIGNDTTLMIDANQKWNVNEAIDYIQQLKDYNIYFIEEPTCPDDILGHAKIREEIKKTTNIQVATGEVCQNRVMFKQFLQADALDIVQIDSCRVGSINELVIILLMAKKFNKRVIPHAGGVGLCELVNHLIIFDYIGVSGEVNMCEYVDHLHDMFVDPCIVKDGNYQCPLVAGYSSELIHKMVLKYTYPDGICWNKTLNQLREQQKLNTRNIQASDKILLTGARGFFGAWICKRLQELNCKIYAADIHENNIILNQVLEDFNNIEFYTLDVSDYNKVFKCIETIKPTHIIHLAGLQVPTCRSKPILGCQVNVMGTLHIFEAVHQIYEKTQNYPTIVYASSAAVCGPPNDYHGMICEDNDHHKPRTFYGVYKLADEGIARIFWQDHKIPSVGLRPLTAYGVGREIGFTSTPTKAIKAALVNRPYEIGFQGMTSFNYVEDVAEIFIQCAYKVNIGAHHCCIEGSPISIHDFVKIAKSLLNENQQDLITITDKDLTIPFPYWYPARTLEALIGHVPNTSVKDGIKKTINIYQEQIKTGTFHTNDL